MWYRKNFIAQLIPITTIISACFLTSCSVQIRALSSPSVRNQFSHNSLIWTEGQNSLTGQVHADWPISVQETSRSVQFFSGSTCDQAVTGEIQTGSATDLPFLSPTTGVYTFRVTYYDAQGLILDRICSSPVNVLHRFHKGISFGPLASPVTINGNLWETQSQATADGLVFSNPTVDSSASVDYAGSAISPFPDPGPDTAQMLKSQTGVTSGNLIFTFPAHNGRYMVTLYALESDYSRARSMDVQIEGVVRETATLAKAQLNEWRRLGPYSVEVTNGAIDVELSATLGTPTISGLEIYETDAPTTAASLRLTAPATMGRQSCELFVVNLQDELGDPTNAVSPTTVTLSHSGSAQAYSDYDCTVPIASVVIANGAYSYGYLKNTVAETDTFSASLTGVIPAVQATLYSSRIFEDTFDQSPLNANLWTPWGSWRPQIISGALNFVPPPNTSNQYPGLGSKNAVDFTDASIVFEISGVLNSQTNSYNTIQLCGDSSGSWGCYTITINGGQIRLNNAAGTTVVTFSHDLILHRFVRLAHSTSAVPATSTPADSVSFSTSPDGTVWTQHAYIPRTIDRALFIEISAGTAVPRSTPGIFAVDRVYMQ